MGTVSAPSDLTERKEALELAGRCADFIRHRSPYIRMLAVSGSLTRPEHRGDHEDADFFAVTKSGRIWEGFMACTWLGWRFSRKLGVPRTFFCFNYLVDEDHPEEIDLSRPEYVREFLRLQVFYGHRYYSRLLVRLGDRLASVEPDLYEDVRRRTMLAADEEQVVDGERPDTLGSTVFYRALRLPFIPLAKWMERRRKRLYPGGLIYSTARVIRSHFRRFWIDAPVDPDGIPSSVAFTRVAQAYDETVVGSPANRHMRALVREQLDKLVRRGDRVLDLGAGTGVDAVWMAKRGALVMAIDVSAGMVRETSRRVAQAGLQDRVDVRRLAIQELGTLLPEHGRRYDVVLANFGALNLSDDSDRWAPTIARLLKPGGYLAANVMSRWSAWELLAGLVRGRPRFALRRLRGEPINIGSVPLAATLYTPRTFIRNIGPLFRAGRSEGFVPSRRLPPWSTLAGGQPGWAGRWSGWTGAWDAGRCSGAWETTFSSSCNSKPTRSLTAASAGP